MDLSDIQGLVFHAYRRHPYAAYALLRFQPDPAAARRWLAELVESRTIDDATPKDVGPEGRPGVRVNLAFTYSGLERIGLCQEALDSFPLTFREGLGLAWPDHHTPDHRSRILGDVGDSAPHNWAWGYQADGRRVDGILMVFAIDPESMHAEVNRWLTRAISVGAMARDSETRLYGSFPLDPREPVREPFGFVDGISQPVLKGALAQLQRSGKRAQPEIHELEDGEILLGHRDGARQVTRTPTLPEWRDPTSILTAARDDAGRRRSANEDTGRRDLGYNGTYLVFRQLAQNVEAFEAACGRHSDDLGISPEYFKALLVGRWANGSPLMKCPIDHDAALDNAPAGNDFSYRNDPAGERCPIGSHVRRANPRDSLGEDPAESWRVANRHRLLRRGRPYHTLEGRGLQFICLNADIARQFEFVQQNWINDTTFGRVTGEDDPLVGSRQGLAHAGAMTLPPPPETRVPRRMLGLERFVTVQGGAYGFLPSLTALRYLAELPQPAPRVEWQPEPVAPGRADRVRFLVHARVPLLLAAALVLAPLALNERFGPSETVRQLFHVGSARDLFLVSALASLAAAVGLFTFRIVQLYATARFDVKTSPRLALTWWRVVMWQLVSLPIVLTTLKLSAGDLTTAGETSWWPYIELGLGAFGGYLAALGFVLLAAAARQSCVRPDNPEDAVLLPSSRLLDWLKRRPSPLLQSGWARWIVDFVETRAAAWPTDRGAGYIDHETGKILPGHLAALAFLSIVSSIYMAAWALRRWPIAAVEVPLPPLAPALFVLLAGALAAAVAAFFLDRFRLPVLSALAAWFLISAYAGGTGGAMFRSDRDQPERPVIEQVVHSRPLGDPPAAGSLETRPSRRE
jgi:Dyp-type peroxidase family